MKCLQGINAVVIRSNESPDPALLEGRGSLLPSMGCGFSPRQGLSHPQECEICLSPTSREILQTPRGMPVWKACSSSIQPLVESCCGHSMRGSHLHFTLLPKCSFLLPAQSHTLVSSTAHVPSPDVGSLDRPPPLKSVGMDPDYDAILQKTAQDETTRSSCLSLQEFQTKGKHAHTTTGDSISHLFAQLVTSQFVPEQKPQACGSHIRRTVCAAESLLKELPQP